MIAPPGKPGYKPAAWHDATDDNIFVSRKVAGPSQPRNTVEAADEAADEAVDVSPLNRLTVILLCIILGLFGGHRYYLGKKKSAVLMTITIGGVALWFLYDLITMLFGGDIRDGENRPVTKWLP